jgi:uncharacterized protein (DUF1697 family)
MALVVFLKGINVGGHRTFRPSVLAKQLARFDVVNVGAAGTFVIRKAASRSAVRAEILRRLPFEAELMICDGGDIVRLASRDPFVRQPSRRDIVRFVSVLSRRPRALPPIPLNLPSADDWCVKVLRCQDRYVLGVYRREMRTISCLGRLEKVLGVPAATRNWNTILEIARILSGGKPLARG